MTPPFLAIPLARLYSEVSENSRLNCPGFGPRPATQAFQPVPAVMWASMPEEAGFFHETPAPFSFIPSPSNGGRG
jgi:hypothetical protein